MDKYNGLQICDQLGLPVDFLPFCFGPGSVRAFIGRGRGRLVHRALCDLVARVGRPCHRITLLYLVNT